MSLNLSCFVDTLLIDIFSNITISETYGIAMEDFISWVGSLASIGGATWAWVQAKSARNSAATAQHARNELIGSRRLAEHSLVHAETTIKPPGRVESHPLIP